MITTTSFALDFVVIGGSIGGLATAYFLQQAGHNVIILEKNKKSSFQVRYPFYGDPG
jgi:glycine/D-amino acid oxidase-like deaminating enzyme